MVCSRKTINKMNNADGSNSIVSENVPLLLYHNGTKILINSHLNPCDSTICAIEQGNSNFKKCNRFMNSTANSKAI